MECLSIPGFSRYAISGDQIYSVAKKSKLTPLCRNNVSRAGVIRYALFSDAGVKERRSIHVWRELAGLPSIRPAKDQDITEQRFYAKTRKQKGGCLLWMGSRDDRGFGRAKHGELLFAHEVSYYFKTGKASKSVIHTCGNRWCVNPDHLKEGTIDERRQTEARRHLKPGWILSPITPKIIVDLINLEVYRNYYRQAEKIKPERNGMYSFYIDNKVHQLSIGEIISGDIRDRTKELNFLRRFWSKVDKGNGTAEECWNWTASTTFGYGHFGDGEWFCREKQAHRISYTLMNGRIGPDMCVLHTCDNPRCVNPYHLRLGTAAENVRDMVRKGRAKTTKFPVAHRSRLKELINTGITIEEAAKHFPDYCANTVYRYMRRYRKYGRM